MARAVDAGRLEFPEWFPPALRVYANREFQFALEEGVSQDVLNRLRRLVAHPDMRKVWIQLLKRKSRTDRNEFLYPANPIKPIPGTEDEARRDIDRLRQWGGSRNLRHAKLFEEILDVAVPLPPIGRSTRSAQSLQNAACGMLLTKAMFFARSEIGVISVKDQKYLSHYFERMAKRLQDEALRLRAFRFEEADAKKLESVAQAYLKKARTVALDPDDLLLVKRKRGDEFVHAYVLRLARRSRELFGGKQLSGCVAIITNAVFETNFSGSHIREMTREKFRSGI
jgi:hypothetical protein